MQVAGVKVSHFLISHVTFQKQKGRSPGRSALTTAYIVQYSSVLHRGTVRRGWRPVVGSVAESLSYLTRNGEFGGGTGQPTTFLLNGCSRSDTFSVLVLGFKARTISLAAYHSTLQYLRRLLLGRELCGNLSLKTRWKATHTQIKSQEYCLFRSWHCASSPRPSACLRSTSE